MGLDNIERITLGRGSVDALLHRHEKNVAATVTRREGDTIVVVRY
jgi:hypothetical protein